MKAFSGIIGALTLAAVPAAMYFAPTVSHFFLALGLLLCGACLCSISCIVKD